MPEFYGLERQFIGTLFGFILWYIVFNTQLLGSFWIRITFASIFLAVYSLIYSKQKFENIRKINKKIFFFGAISGILFYIIVLLGFQIFKPFVVEGVSNVYFFKMDPFFSLSPVLLLVTSFCEELFWRGYIQDSLLIKFRKDLGILFSSILYSLIHVSTFNLPLIIVAFIAGCFWGVSYSKTSSLWFVIISHFVWTELMFVFYPLL